MPHPNQKIIPFTTKRGALILRSFCQPDEIAEMSFCDDFKDYAQYNPIISQKESLIEAASQPDANVTLALMSDSLIVGLSLLVYPDPDERWLRGGPKIMMELAAIEVSKPWRAGGLAKKLLSMAIDCPFEMERIFYMVGYSWTWDLDNKQKSATDYRNRLIHLFTGESFAIFQTNESNVMLRPENLFMARIGDYVPEKTRKQFKMVRFNLDI
jgi:acetoin utilization protein AcuA